MNESSPVPFADLLFNVNMLDTVQLTGAYCKNCVKLNSVLTDTV